MEVINDLILEDEIEIGLHSKTIKHLKELGYKIPQIPDINGKLRVPYGTKIKVKIIDLPKESHHLINVKCDNPNCNQILNVEWRAYLKYLREDGKYYCVKCAHNLFARKTIKQTLLKNGISFAQWGIDNLGNDFLEKYWDYRKNENLCIDPWNISANTHDKFWIKCQEKDYHGSYYLNGNMFVTNNNRCSYCSGKKVHILDSLGLLHPKVISIWSNKNTKSAYEYSEFSMKKVWWKCENEKHDEYFREISVSNACDFRCPKCSIEREESFLQEGVRTYLNELGYELLHENNCNLSPLNPKTKYPLRYDNEVVDLKLIIEVHGLQHYQYTKTWHKSKEHFNELKIRDCYKKYYAISKGYNYLEIPYTALVNDEYKTIINSEISKIKKSNIINLKGDTKLRKIISLDLDSTLNTLDTEWFSIYNKDYNDNLTREDIVRWETHTIVKPECGNKIYDYLLTPKFFRNLGIKPHAKEVTEWLSQYFDLYIVTAYHPKTCLDKAEWVEHYLPHIPIKNIIFCNFKGLIHTDYLIDDGGHNILDFSENNKSGLPIVFDAPWNKYLENKFIRVYDWLEIKEVISELL
jgi:5'-nucleotidase